MPLKRLLQQNISFFIPLVIFLIVGIFFLVTYPKGTLHLMMNTWFHPSLDPFFKYVTWFGDGMIYLFIAPVMALVRWRLFVGLVITGILTLILTGSLKHLVFEDNARPARYFTSAENLRLVEGVDINHHHSFPSGHTMAAFACYGFLALMVHRITMKLFLFFLALAVGYSRIYLSQHFLEDVIAGAALGTMVAILGYYLMEWLNWPHEEARIKWRRPKNP